VIAHEVYHSLGLPHSFENRNHIPQTLQGGNREIQSNGEYSFGYKTKPILWITQITGIIYSIGK